MPQGVFAGLLELDLSENPLESWGEVLRFSSLPALRRLTVNQCGIDKLHFDEESCFASLSMLQFSRNLISDWRSVSALGRLSSLEDVKVRNNPVLETEDGETCRQLFIASIPSIKVN